MRLGTKSSNVFIQSLNDKNKLIQEYYLEKIKDNTITVNVKVMLGDSTVSDQTTFDPNLVGKFYKKITDKLQDWDIQKITITNNEGLRRIFTKYEIREGNYLLSGHMSLQFHVLLYYKSHYRVMECQKELADIIDKTKSGENKMAEFGNQLIVSKMKEMGYDEPDHQKLFEIFFENDELRDKIYKEIEKKSDVSFQELLNKKTDLFNELDSFLLEIFQTSPVLIDDNRLVTGEEGGLCTFDLEFIKNKNREGLFDPKKIPEQVKEKLLNRLDQFFEFMKL